MKHRLCGVAAASLVLTMVSAAAAQPGGQASPDMKEIQSYRLTMEGVKKVQVATRALFEELKKDPKYQALMKLEAEKATLEKKDDRTEAEDARLEAIEQEKDKLESEHDDLDMGSATTLNEMEARIKKSGPMTTALKQAGMPPREYATFMMAMVQAAMVAGFKKSGMVKELPKDVNAENVKFIEEHEAELKALQEEFQKMAKGGD